MAIFVEVHLIQSHSISLFAHLGDLRRSCCSFCVLVMLLVSKGGGGGVSLASGDGAIPSIIGNGTGVAAEAKM